jgi:hypothetical protein
MISILRMIEINGDRNEFPARACFPLPQKTVAAASRAQAIQSQAEGSE